MFFNDFDIVGLTLLGAATEQDDEGFAVLAEVNPIAWAPINFEFRNAVPRRFDVRKVTSCDLFQSRCDLRCGRRIQPGEPSPEGAFSLFVDVLADFDQQSNDNTYVILLKGKPWL